MLCESKLKIMKKSKQKTSKKGFHFTAETEAEMAKWVERFCSVCGLKINDEASVDYRYSPQPNSEFASATSITSNDYSTQPVPEFSNSSNHVSNLIDTENEIFDSQDCLSPCNSNQLNEKFCEPSSTYIPIFECHTGKPLNSNQIKENSVPRIPSNSQLSEEFYDVPKSIFIKVPPPSRAFQRFNTINHFPKVNWSTYPAETSFISDKKRASVRSLDPTLESSSNSKNSPPLNHCHKNENRRCSTPFNNEYYNEIKQNDEKLHPPPPRPPKPLSWKSRSKSESCSSLLESNTIHLSEVAGSQVNDSPFTEAFSNAQSINLDYTYDFPKSDPMHSCNIRATVPAPLKNSKGSSHSYTNAPPGHRNTKNNFFDYDYRTLLPSCDDSNNSFDSESCDKSPLTPNSAFNFLSSNVFSDSLTPPAVNRDLKPKRKGSDSDVTSSPTTPTISSFNFTSPPALSNISNMPVNQRFRKPSPNQLNVTPPRIPSRVRQFHNSRDASTSEDDTTNPSGKLIRRNSSNEDQVRRSVPLHRRSPIDSTGLTYLDLDLESETNSSSPCTQNHNDNLHKSYIQNSKENDNNVDVLNSNGSESNVYKTIDFVKTEAFNKLRIGLEESHRSSQ